MATVWEVRGGKGGSCRSILHLLLAPLTSSSPQTRGESAVSSCSHHCLVSLYRTTYFHVCECASVGRPCPQSPFWYGPTARYSQVHSGQVSVSSLSLWVWWVRQVAKASSPTHGSLRHPYVVEVEVGTETQQHDGCQHVVDQVPELGLQVPLTVPEYLARDRGCLWFVSLKTQMKCLVCVCVCKCVCVCVGNSPAPWRSRRPAGYTWRRKR